MTLHHFSELYFLIWLWVQARLTKTVTTKVKKADVQTKVWKNYIKLSLNYIFFTLSLAQYEDLTPSSFPVRAIHWKQYAIFWFSRR